MVAAINFIKENNDHSLLAAIPEVPKPRRGSPGRLYSFKTINYALQLCELRKIALRTRGKTRKYTYQAIANKVGVWSKNTISKWDHMEMSAEAIYNRLKRKAHNKFTPEEEKIIAGWIVCKDLTQESSTTEKFSEFVLTYFGKEVSASFITRFMRRNHLSLKLVGRAHQAERSQDTFDAGVRFFDAFRAIVEKYKVKPQQIHCIDKTYLQTSPYHKYVKHITIKGQAKPRKITCDRGAVSEIWTTLRSDGKKAPFFVQTKESKIANMQIFGPDDDAHISFLERQINPVTKKDVRPGERGCLLYFDYMINTVQFFKKGDYVLFDGEKSFQTSLVRNLLAENGINTLLIEPTVLHQLINPCDNHFHSLFKLSYYRKISNGNFSNISIKEKLNLAKQSYEEINEEDVQNMFKRCGLAENELDSADVLSNLMFEGMGYTRGENKKVHSNQLQSFLQWCEDNDLNHLSSSLTVEMLRIAGMCK